MILKGEFRQGIQRRPQCEMKEPVFYDNKYELQPGMEVWLNIELLNMLPNRKSLAWAKVAVEGVG